MSERAIDRLLAAGIFTIVLTTTVAVSGRQGVHRDEAYYMDAGEQYAGYWEKTLRGQLDHPFSDGSIRRFWDYNHEHPPLMKLLYGFSWRLLHRCDCAREAKWHAGAAVLRAGRHGTLPIFSEITAFRFPTMICFALLCALVFLWSVEAHRVRTGKDGGGRAGALAAALLMAAQPRAFFHAQTASFDLPAAMFWFATTWAYWKALASRRQVLAGLGVGALYGLFLATKLQSFFLPFALQGHYGLILCGHLLRLYRRAGSIGERILLAGAMVLAFVPVVCVFAYLVATWDERRRQGAPNAPNGIFAMFYLSPLVVTALWPWLWHHGVARFGGYIGFHWKHVHYNFEYLGTNYNRPPYPWHEPLGLLVTTAPVVLLALALAGGVFLARRGIAALRHAASSRRAGGLDPRATAPIVDGRATSLLWLACAVTPVAPFFLGNTPIFGETKHWLGAMPFLAVAAGVAVEALIDRLALEIPRLRRIAIAAAVVTIAVVPAAVETWRSHPYGLSHYNALAGGAPGGADLGMNRQFWGYSVRGLLPWFNANLPEGSRIYLHDWNHDSYEMYLRDGLLRPDLRDAGMEIGGVRSSDTALVIHEKHFNKYEYMIWDVYKTVRPAQVLTYDGVPLVTVYRRAERAEQPR